MRQKQKDEAVSHFRVASRARSAFTLVELLVVVSIIALLISILLPSLRKAREQGKQVKCLAHMRGTAQAALVFANDNGNRTQLVASAGNANAIDSAKQRFAYGGGEAELLSWPAALARVIATGYTNNWDWGVRATSYSEALADVWLVNKGMEMFTCPSDQVQLSSTFFPRYQPSMYGEGLEGMGDPRKPVAPTDGMSYWGRLSYGINEDIAGGDGADYDFWPSCWRAVKGVDGGWTGCTGGTQYGPSSPCFRSSGSRLRGELDKVFGPSEVGLFFETGPESETQAANINFAKQYANLINSTARQEFPLRSGPYLGHSQQSHPWRIPTNRHPGGYLNVAYADMHGEAVRVSGHEYNGEVQRDLPNEYAPRVRVSPYNPHGVQ